MDLLLFHKYITVCGIVHERNIPEAGQERFWMLSLVLPPPTVLDLQGLGPHPPFYLPCHLTTLSKLPSFRGSGASLPFVLKTRSTRPAVSLQRNHGAG